MNALFYIPTTREKSERIYDVIEIVSSSATVEIFESIEDLSHRLRQPVNSSSIATLLVRNRKDLLRLASIRDLLSGLPLIIILPDRRKANVTIGYSLSPRFLTYEDGNFIEVGAVLGKMLENYNKEEVKRETA